MAERPVLWNWLPDDALLQALKKRRSWRRHERWWIWLLSGYWLLYCIWLLATAAYFALNPALGLDSLQAASIRLDRTFEPAMLYFLYVAGLWFAWGLHHTLYDSFVSLSATRKPILDEALRHTPISTTVIGTTLLWFLFRGMFPRLALASLLVWPCLSYFRWFTGPVMVASYMSDPTEGIHRKLIVDLLVRRSFPDFLYDELWIWDGALLINLFGPLTVAALAVSGALAILLLIALSIASGRLMQPSGAMLGALGWAGFSFCLVWGFRFPAKAYFYDALIPYTYPENAPWLAYSVALSIVIFGGVLCVLWLTAAAQSRWLALGSPYLFCLVLLWLGGPGSDYFPRVMDLMSPNVTEFPATSYFTVHAVLPLSIFGAINPLALPLLWNWGNGDVFDRYDLWYVGWHRLPLLLCLQVAALIILLRSLRRSIDLWRRAA